MGFYDKIAKFGQKALTQAAITYSAYQAGKNDESENSDIKTIQTIERVSGTKAIESDSHILEYSVFTCIGIALLLLICIFFKLYMKKTLLRDRIIRMSTIRRTNEAANNQNEV